MIRHALFVLAVAVTTANAQAVTGTWSATFDSDMTMKKDSFVVKSRGPATLVLTQRGDSVSGTWSSGLGGARDVHGTFDGRVLRLTTGLNESEVRINGEPHKMKVRTDWMGTMQGNRLAGTMFIRIGDREPPARRWEADRK
jgi:hypothetical protein